MTGLEVSAENVGPVTDVLRAAGVEVNPADLPSRQSETALEIADEAHFFIKAIYIEKTGNTETWAINKDGTSRQKKKILTTIVSLDSGEKLPLGFRFVSKETADNIATTIQKDLKELCMIKQIMDKKLEQDHD
nr:hypothetical protein BaRGS_030000 [Batillaria attramentaria]